MSFTTRTSDYPRCRRCRAPFDAYEDDSEFGTGLCYECFEEGVEAAEERRRERAARSNEY